MRIVLLTINLLLEQGIPHHTRSAYQAGLSSAVPTATPLSENI